MFNKTSLNLKLPSVTKSTKQKKTQNYKTKITLSIAEISDEEEDYLEMNEEVKNVKEPKDGVSLVKKYEIFLKGANRKIINIVRKQVELLKRFKDSDKFFSRVGLSRSNVYFKIRLYKCLCSLVYKILFSE